MSRWRRPVPARCRPAARRWRDDFVANTARPSRTRRSGPRSRRAAIWLTFRVRLQLHHGTADESVPTEFSQTLYQQVQAAKLSVPVEYYEYPGDNHNLSKSFNTAMQRSIAFFDVREKRGPAGAATRN